MRFLSVRGGGWVAEIDQKIVDIEQITTEVFALANTGSTGAAAIAFAKAKIAAGASKKVLVGAGGGSR